MAEFRKVISEAHRMCSKYTYPLNNVCKGCPACAETGRYGEQDCALETLINLAIFDDLDANASEAYAKKFEKIVMDWSKKNPKENKP